MIIMNRRIYLAFLLVLCSIIPSSIGGTIAELFISFYSLSVAVLSLLLALLIHRTSNGEAKTFMKYLSLTLAFQLLFLSLTTNMLLNRHFVLSLEVFVAAVFSYFSILVYGIRKLAVEFKFLSPERLAIPVPVSSAVLITVMIYSKPDAMLWLLLLDIAVIFIFLSLFAIYAKAENYVYWLMVSVAFLLQFPAKMLMSLSNYEVGYLYTIPAALYNLSLSTFLLCLYEIHHRKVKIPNLRELEERVKNYETLLDRINELKEAFRLMNQALRYDVLKKLQIISGYVESYEITNDSRFLQKAIENVKECAEYVEKIGSLDSVISADKAEIRPVDVKRVVEEVRANYEIPIIVKGLCVAMADEALSLVLENLMDNAVRHSGTDRIEIVLSEVAGEAEIRVVDYGTGIPEDVKKRLFEKAFRYGETAGLGLGLYIVKKIVERYGGKVWVEDTKPKGATFVIRLRTTQTSEPQ
jgi:signal transduction histidine kinase